MLLNSASHFMINFNEKVSEGTEESKMLTLRLRCVRVREGKRYKVT